MSNATASPCHILIVADDTTVATTTEAMLLHLGHIVDGTAHTADEAMTLARRAHPDLVLFDVLQADEQRAIITARNLREMLNIPVVFITSHSSASFIEQARSSGPYGLITRPFRAEDLHAAIHAALHQHRTLQKLFAERGWLSTMLRTMSDGVIVTDAEGCVRFLNPAAELSIGWTSQQAQGRPIEEVYVLQRLDGGPVAQCQLRRALQTRTAIPKESFRMTRRDGHAMLVEDSAAPVIEDGVLIGGVTIFFDATDRELETSKQREQQAVLEESVRVTGEDLMQTRDDLHVLFDQMQSVQEHEQARIAREVHDNLQQQTAVMSMQIQTLRRVAIASGAEAETAIGELERQLEKLANDLRAVSHQLHPAMILELGLAQGLNKIAADLREQGRDVSLVVRKVPDEIAPDLSTAYFRIAQEALSNAGKHAPGAPVQVTLEQWGAELYLQIDDAGPGFVHDAVRNRPGLGLLSIQERARSVGGSLLLLSTPGEGTSVRVRAPIKRTLTH